MSEEHEAALTRIIVGQQHTMQGQLELITKMHEDSQVEVSPEVWSAMKTSTVVPSSPFPLSGSVLEPNVQVVKMKGREPREFWIGRKKASNAIGTAYPYEISLETYSGGGDDQCELVHVQELFDD